MAARSYRMQLQHEHQDAGRRALLTPQGLPSPPPRRPHVDGDIPPELSPLDIFVSQGMMLSKQLEQPSKDGKRMSRLPPTAIASSLAQSRPGYLRSTSADPPGNGSSAAFPSDHKVTNGGLKGELEVPDARPMSIYPRMSNVPSLDHPSNSPHLPLLYNRRRQSSDALSRLSSQAEDPPPPAIQSARTPEPERELSMRPKRSFDVHRQFPPPQRDASTGSNRSRQYQSSGLAPPASPRHRQASSIRSVPPDSSDDDGTNSLRGSFVSTQRGAVGRDFPSGRASPPFSPFNAPPRSPSVSSEYSTNGGRLSRPAFNFSRPISRASRPSLESSIQRQESTDSYRSQYIDDTVHTPISMTSEDQPDASDPSAPAQSYIYSRFALPRGRALERGSIIFTDEGEILNPPRNRSNMSNANQSDTSSPARTHQRPLSPPSPPSPRYGARSTTPSAEASPGRPSTAPREAPMTPKNLEVKFAQPSASPATGATLKPRENPSKAISTEISAEEHLAKGIECHENGSLKESTYHLRIAAKQNHPTGMLLYALACRHGWGMRPNQREGVEWLRKAADSASLEVADDEDLLKEGVSGDYNERKTRRAQFALSIYELGVSHMNGWGIEQDKVLALRCFEIAGSWGDGDAMTEAGFCYAQGVGCKKDLKKAARFYRMAESKGVSMIGNSWIYKSKYSEESERTGRSRGDGGDEKKKPRDKSRTRTMFGRKKSTA